MFWYGYGEACWNVSTLPFLLNLGIQTLTINLKKGGGGRAIYIYLYINTGTAGSFTSLRKPLMTLWAQNFPSLLIWVARHGCGHRRFPAAAFPLCGSEELWRFPQQCNRAAQHPRGLHTAGNTKQSVTEWSARRWKELGWPSRNWCVAILPELAPKILKCS